jgi:hypothetical protein
MGFSEMHGKLLLTREKECKFLKPWGKSNKSIALVGLDWNLCIVK